MSNGILLLTDNAARRATLASSPACVSGWGVDQLQRQGREGAARVDGVSGTWSLTGDLPDAETLNVWSIPRHNLTGLGRVRMRCWDGAGQSGNLTYDSGELAAGRLIPWDEIRWGIDPWGASYEDATGLSVTPLYSVADVDGAVVRSFQIDVVDSANPDGYLQIGRLIFGMALRSRLGPMRQGFSWAWVDTAEHGTTGAGGPATEDGAQYRMVQFRLGMQEEAERAAFGRAIKTAGKRTDCLLAVFPWAEDGSQLQADFTLIGRFIDLPTWGGDPTVWWGADYKVREV